MLAMAMEIYPWDLPCILHGLLLLVFAYPLLQLVVTADLGRRLRRGSPRPSQRTRQAYLVLLVVLPSLALLVAVEHLPAIWLGGPVPVWASRLYERTARFALLPLWTLAAFCLGHALCRPSMLYGRAHVLLAAGTLAFICLGYALAVAASSLTPLAQSGAGPSALAGRDPLDALFAIFLVIVPGLPCVNLVLLMVHIWRHAQGPGRCHGRRLATRHQAQVRLGSGQLGDGHIGDMS